MRLTMVGMRRVVLASAGAGVLLAAHAAQAQGSCTFTDEKGNTVTWPNCKPPADAPVPGAAGTPAAGTPGAASAPANPPAGPKSFPYPGDSSAGKVPEAPSAGGQTGGQAAGQGGGGQSAGQSGSAGGGAAPAAGGAAGGRFPYPGDHSAGAGSAAGAGAGSAAGDGSQAGSSSSSQPPLNDAGSSGSSSSDGDPSAGPLGDDDPAAQAAAARHAKAQRHGIAFHQTADQREVEDLKVASFYQNDGNYRGAYERATDAVSIADDDAEAHLALADAARHLGKLDEAEKNYRKCLALDPVPKTANAAKKALKEMSGGD